MKLDISLPLIPLPADFPENLTAIYITIIPLSLLCRQAVQSIKLFKLRPVHLIIKSFPLHQFAVCPLLHDLTVIYD